MTAKNLLRIFALLLLFASPRASAARTGRCSGVFQGCDPQEDHNDECCDGLECGDENFCVPVCPENGSCGESAEDDCVCPKGSTCVCNHWGFGCSCVGCGMDNDGCYSSALADCCDGYYCSGEPELTCKKCIAANNECSPLRDKFFNPCCWPLGCLDSRCSECVGVNGLCDDDSPPCCDGLSCGDEFDNICCLTNAGDPCGTFAPCCYGLLCHGEKCVECARETESCRGMQCCDFNNYCDPFNETCRPCVADGRNCQTNIECCSEICSDNKCAERTKEFKTQQL